MVESLLADWKEGVAISRDQWDDTRDSVVQKLGVDAPDSGMVSMFTPNHPVFESGGFHNWTQLVPDDAIQQLRDSDNRAAEVIDITLDMYDRLDAGTDEPLSAPIVGSDLDISEFINKDAIEIDVNTLKAGQLWYIASQLIGQYSGNVNFDRLNGDVSPEERAQDVEAPANAVTVLIYRWREQNLEDIAVFSVDSGQTFFGEAFGDSTLMFKCLLQSQKQPEYIATNVAFNADGNSWGNSTPPDYPISVISIDHKNRVGFNEIPDPAESCKDTWGDVAAMMSELSDNEYVHTYAAGGVDWQIGLGI